MINFGPVPASSVLPIFFNSYDANGASITLTGLAVTDIEIYKGVSMTQRASDAGYALIDTDGIDIDSITGLHAFSIDLGDNTDAGFFAVGSFYTVVVSAVTVSAQTVSFIAATFRIVAAEAVAGKPKVDVDAWLGTAAATPTVGGVPEVDVTHFNGTAGTFAAGIPETKVNNIAAGAITAAAVATGAIDADAIAADAVTEIQNGLATAAALTTVDDFLDTEVAAILAAVDTEVAAIKAVTDALPNAGALTTIQADLDDIQTRIPAALVSGRIDASVGAMAANVMTAAAAAADLTTELQTGLATAAALATVAAFVDTEVAAILSDTNAIILDTNDIQTRLPAALVGGRMDASVGAMAANTLTAAATAADFSTEVVAAVLAATITELSGVPGASPTLVQAIAFLYMAVRNRRETTATSDKIENDAGAAIGTAVLSDDGTTFTKGEYA